MTWPDRRIAAGELQLNRFEPWHVDRSSIAERNPLTMTAGLKHTSPEAEIRFRARMLTALRYLPGVLLALILLAGNASAESDPDPRRCPEPIPRRSIYQPEVEMVFSGGYRHDDLDWNIGGFFLGQYVNVLSELTWDDIESYQVKFQGSLVWPNIIALKGLADYGWIFDGDNQDSDYAGNNRTLEFSRSNNSADDGSVWDVSLAIGYPFRWGKSVISTITPLAGYSRHEQNLKITDGSQSIPPTGPFPGLNSSYDTEWKGPWIGIDLNFRASKIQSVAERFETLLTYEYHWADYEAEADWNLREDFRRPRSFVHDADGRGWVVRAGLNFVLQRHLALNFNFDYQDWSTGSGTDKIFFADGTTAKTRLNEVNWTSYSLGLGISVRF